MAENTPYDDAFKTVVHDCKSLLIPLVNEVFHEQFSADATVSFSSNEHFLNQPDGIQQKRVSDALFTIQEAFFKNYHWECQSDSDASILIRIFEYASQAALDDAVLERGSLTVSFPHSAILYLKYPKSLPDKLRINIQTPGGTIGYEVAVMKLGNYSLDTIFEKKLLLLLPFYIFHYDGQLDALNQNPDQLSVLKQEFLSIKSRLEQLRASGDITEFIKITLIDMTQKVVRNFAKKYSNIKEGVKSVMGGRILDTEARRILNQGIAVGEARGEVKGQAKGEIKGRILEYIEIRREDGHSDETILNSVIERFHLTKEEACEYLYSSAAI